MKFQMVSPVKGTLPIKLKSKQGNRGDMQKIHVTRQFFEASGRHGDLIEKTKNSVFR